MLLYQLMGSGLKFYQLLGTCLDHKCCSNVCLHSANGAHRLRNSANGAPHLRNTANGTPHLRNSANGAPHLRNSANGMPHLRNYSASADQSVFFGGFLPVFLSCFLLFHRQFVYEMPFLQKESLHLTFSSRRSAIYKSPPRIGGHHFLLCQHTNTKDIAGQSAIQNVV